MKWMEYPDREGFRTGRGAHIEGQYISDAPGGRWFITPDQRFHLVKLSAGQPYCIAENDPLSPSSPARSSR